MTTAIEPGVKLRKDQSEPDECKEKQIASVKTTVDLDDEMHAKVQSSAGLIGEKPATILSLLFARDCLF